MDFMRELLFIFIYIPTCAFCLNEHFAKIILQIELLLI